VAVIATPGSTAATLAAKAATTTIPIVFVIGADPVKIGLVASLNRPGGNVTGINDIGVDIGAKRLGFLQELLPRATRFGVLVNPDNPSITESFVTELQTAASAIGRQIEVVTASTNADIDTAFATLVKKRADALLNCPDALFVTRRVQLITLAVRHALPALYHRRELAEAGGLMSYGSDLPDQFRQTGGYVGRILKGEKPADMPVQLPTRFEFVINLQNRQDARHRRAAHAARPRRRGDRVIRRREFITLLGGAAVAWPLAARAQQPAMPVVGFLGASAPDTGRARAFHLGLKETGYVEGDSVTILYRWAENHMDRLPELAADLARRRVAVLASFGNAPALAAKGATTTVPIVFGAGEDPVRSGLVASLARPGGNLTGISILSVELVTKRLELLRELVPAVAKVAVLVDPASPVTETMLREVEMAARSMGLRAQILNASSSGEIDAAFATLARERPDALFVGSGFLLNSRRVQLVHLATLHKVPAIYSSRESVEAGGLMSYGPSLTDAHRQIGVYAGRILKGAKPADFASPAGVEV